jgi:hypothetical protein
MFIHNIAASLGVALLALLPSPPAKAEISDVVVLFVKVDLNNDRVLSPA